MRMYAISIFARDDGDVVMERNSDKVIISPEQLPIVIGELQRIMLERQDLEAKDAGDPE